MWGHDLTYLPLALSVVQCHQGGRAFDRSCYVSLGLIWFQSLAMGNAECRNTSLKSGMTEQKLAKLLDNLIMFYSWFRLSVVVSFALQHSHYTVS